MPLRGARGAPAPQPRDGFRAVGRVERPWGLRGEIKVLPLTDYPERFAPGARVFVGGADRRVRHSRWHKGRVFVALDGVDRVEAAEALRGTLLEIPEDETPAFAEGEYYIDQIEGCEVVSLGGEPLGRVTEVLRPGANDVYVVRGAARRELLIPALRRTVVAVDLEARRITVDLSSGDLPADALPAGGGAPEPAAPD
ncbi:MAG: 16S rRNA processing protein RimM [Chloroflexi bacterium]|nr:16S rRNA processing protein RimM [Chloroflexota bacterium]